VTVTPQSSGAGWVIFWGWLLLMGVGAVVGHTSAPSPSQFKSPFGEAPGSIEPNPYDNIILPPDGIAPQPVEHGAGRLVIPGDSYQQCRVDGSATAVKLAPFRYLIDTGAWTVAFSRAAAQAMGLDPATLVYDQTISTANGIGKAANIRLRELRVGEFVLNDVPAQVNYSGMGNPLLGATALRKFLRLEYAQGDCILTMAADNNAHGGSPKKKPGPND
jgi:clan AA aspartic protease (TIGR02281 family)